MRPTKPTKTLQNLPCNLNLKLDGAVMAEDKLISYHLKNGNIDRHYFYHVYHSYLY